MIKRWKQAWMAQIVQHARNRGYTWAWIQWRLHGRSVDSLRARIFCAVPTDKREEAFYTGARQALQDIYAVQGILR